MLAALRKELRRTFSLSVPITLGLVGQSLYGVFDTVLVANILGEHALSAATLGNNITWVPLLFACGLCVAIPVLTAQALGAGRRESVPAILRHGLLIGIGVSILGAALTCAFVCGNGFELLRQPPDVAADAKRYACIVASSLPVAAGFQAVKFFRDATGGQWISLFWMLAGLVVKILLSWMLMSGAFFFPDWGLEGAAAGTFVARVFALTGIVLHKRLVCNFHEGFSLARIRENLRISFPSALHIVFEAGIFIVSPFFMGWIGDSAIAANQVVLTLSGLAYMFPLGISQALSIRIGAAFGRRNMPRIRIIFAGATGATLTAIAVAAAVFIAVRSKIPPLFNLGDEAAELAENFLIVAGAYMLFDAFQTLAAGTLRGVSDVRIIAVAAFFSYWVVGCPTSLVLAFPLGLGGVGIWIGLATGLALIACILGVRVYKNLSRPRVPAPAAESAF